MLTKIQAAHEMNKVAQHWRVKMSPDEAREYFKGRKFQEMIEEIDVFIPAMQFGPGNPNNGKPFHTYWVGREYSMVVYVEIITTYRDDVNFDAVAQEVMRVGGGYGATEASITDESLSKVVRLWFDKN